MTKRKTRIDSALRIATHLGVRAARSYRKSESWLRRRAEARSVTAYDDRTARFVGSETEPLDVSSFERSLRLLWKAELEAPYLGIHDASKSERSAHFTGDVSSETTGLLESATSNHMRDEISSRFSPDEREAINEILSLIVHGEAYALYVSASLVPFALGTTSKLNLSMQVLEEAKHYVVLRALSTTLAGDTKPLRASGRIFLERVARANPLDRLFGLNILMESFAMEFFVEFSRYPGFGPLLQKFLMDESRHCAFPPTYARSGFVPERVRNSFQNRLRRTRMVVTALPIIFDYRPYFERLGLDSVQFFSNVLGRVVRLAEQANMPLLLGADQYLAFANIMMNCCVRAMEPGQYEFRDYCALHADFDISRFPVNEQWYWNLYLDAVEVMSSRR